jgi:LuxR family transcriptional regulator, maltose regulon positive regulatory protein
MHNLASKKRELHSVVHVQLYQYNHPMPLTRFLETKFHIPAWRSTGVSRPRLVEQLQTGLQEGRRLTLISAPAGYGKSMLVAEWIHRLSASPVHVAWLSLDESENAPTRFLGYLLSAFTRIDPNLGQSARGLLEMPQLPSEAAFLDELINDLSTLQTQTLLVLDDYHLITHPAIHESLAYFLENQPQQIHLVITTRADPPLPVARLRASAGMTEIRVHHLRFTLDETRQFINQALHLESQPEWIDELEARTEGWAAGLQLAALALQNLPNQQDFIQTFRGSHRYILDYLAEEVMRQLGEDIYRFLTQTSALERFNASLCDAITGRTDSQALLMQLEQANLFLIPLDHERDWYRFHHLFSDYLRTGLAQDQQAQLHTMASAWFEMNEMPFEAVRYALASNYIEFAADMIERVIQDPSIWSGGSLATLAGWVEALSPQTLQSHPVLSLHAARVMYLTGQLDLSEMLLAHAEDSLGGLPAPDRERWLATADSYHGAIAAQRGEIQRAIHLTTGALERLPVEDLLIRARAAFTLALSYDSAGNTQKAIQAYLDSSKLAQTADVSYLAINARCEAALLQIQQGHLQQAAHTCQEALKIDGDENIPPAGIALAILGEIARERNDLQAASRYLAEGIDLSRRGGLIEDLRIELLFLARLRASQGDMLAAQAAVDQAISIMRSYHSSRIGTLADAIQARMHLAVGKIQAAVLWANQYHDTRLTQRVEYLREFEDLVLAHTLFVTGERQQAQQILDTLIEQAQNAGRNRACIEALILKAQILQAEDELSAACESLEKALSLAVPSGFYRIFIDAAPAISNLLSQLRGESAFADELRRMIQSESVRTGTGELQRVSRLDADSQINPLSEQERRVLQLVVAGKSNREIAADLVISVGTAKWHVHNILQKLGVNNRPQAIARAHELGLE